MNSVYCSILALMVVSTAGSAQTESVQAIRPASVFSAKHFGSLVRAARQPNTQVTGRLIALDDSALTLESKRTPVRIPWGEVDTLWFAHRSTARGMLIGGVISAIALSVAVCQPTCEESGVIFPGVFITPLPGLVAGALVGSRIVRWKRHWP